MNKKFKIPFLCYDNVYLLRIKNKFLQFVFDNFVFRIDDCIFSVDTFLSNQQGPLLA